MSVKPFGKCLQLLLLIVIGVSVTNSLAAAESIKILILPSTNHCSNSDFPNVLDANYDVERNSYCVAVDKILNDALKSCDGAEILHIEKMGKDSHPEFRNIYEALLNGQYRQELVKDNLSIIKKVTGARILVMPELNIVQNYDKTRYSMSIAYILDGYGDSIGFSHTSAPSVIEALPSMIKESLPPLPDAIVARHVNYLGWEQTKAQEKADDEIRAEKKQQETLSNEFRATPMARGIYEEHKDYKTMLAQYTKFNREIPYWEYYYYLGLSYINTGNPKAGIDPLNKAFALMSASHIISNSDAADVQCALGEAEYRVADYSASCKCFDTALQLKPTSLADRTMQALAVSAYIESKQYQRVIDVTNDVVKRPDWDVDLTVVVPRLRSAMLLKNSEVQEECIERLRTDIESKRGQKEYKQMSEVLQILSDMNVASPEDLHNLAFTYDMTGKREKAHQLFEKVLTLKPDNMQTHFDLMIRCLEDKHPEQVPALYNRAIQYAKATTDQAHLHYLLGVAYFHSAKEDQAAKEFKTASGLDPDKSVSIEPAINTCRLGKARRLANVDDSLGVLQVEKNPTRYKGRAVHWTGEIVDVVERGGRTWIALLVGDEPVQVTLAGDTFLVKGDHCETIGRIGGTGRLTWARRVHTVPLINASMMSYVANTWIKTDIF